ncbi:hypothetical protein MPDQ_003192 [Monascus purpureus]|uniref:Uncharacterized protein n=1 Tax=Monascus purpureus TaxID=5098 RepID=A0A507QNN1_MONPU|nr:hypothetical protein MPDQ_003192 [Monascus purpureus]
MPLVVPGVNFPVNKRSEWLDKLKGKRFIESEEAATDVNLTHASVYYIQSFTRKDLPKGCRVVKPGQVITMDFIEDRLNVNLDENNMVKDIGFY